MANLTSLPPNPPEEWNEPDIPQAQDPIEAFMLPILRARYLIFLCCILGATMGIGFALSKPNEYTSMGKLFFRPGQRESRTPDDMMDPENEYGSAQAALTDELEILRDRANVFRVVAIEIGPDRILAPYDPTADETPSTSGVKKLLNRVQKWWFARGVDPGGMDNTDERVVVAATTALEEGLVLAPVDRSNVIYATYKTHSPILAHDVVDVFLKAAQERHTAVFSQSAKESAALAKNELELARGTVKDAEDRFNKYARRNGIVDLETQKSAMISEVSEIEKEVSEADRKLIRLDVEKRSLEQRHGKMKRYETIEIPPQQVENPEYVALDERLNHLRKEETFLKLEIAKGGHFVESQRKRLGAVQSEIGRITKTIGSVEPTILTKATSKTEENPAYSELSERLEDLIASRDGMAQAKLKTDELLQDRRRQLRALNEAEPEYLSLARAAAEARTKLTETERALDEILRMGKLDASAELTNLQVISPANTPNEKSGPKRSIIVAGGFAGGIGVGIAIAFALAFFDRRFRRPQDIERVLGVKVLGVVPDAKRLSMSKRIN